MAKKTKLEDKAPEDLSNEELLALQDRYYQAIVDDSGDLDRLLEIERELTLRENQ